MRRLKDLFLGVSGRSAVEGDRAADDLRLSAAALLVEAAMIDGDFGDAERRTIAGQLADRFHLSAAEVAALIEDARQATEESTQLYAFTRAVKDGFSPDERLRMIEMLWEVVYADGRLHDYEASLVRRVAGLIYVPDRESGAARKRALRRLGLSGAVAS